jgi:hypothetical protein
VLRSVRDKLIDQEAKWNCLVRRNHEVVEVAVYLETVWRACEDL